MAYFGTTVRLVQRGTITINNGSASGTATLGTTLLDLTKCELRLLGYEIPDSGTTDPRRWFPRIALTNTTTVTATLNVVSNGVTTVGFEVTELI